MRRNPNWYRATGAAKRWSMLAVSAGVLASAGCDSGQASDGAGLVAQRSDLTAAGNAESDRIQQFLDSRYRHTDVRHTYRGSSGQEIDCVDIMAQPALKHPDLRGHTPWRTVPSFLPPPKMSSIPTPRPEDDGTDEQGRARRCPEGSVPIVKRSADSIRHAGGLDSFLLHAGTKGAPPRHSENAPTAPPALPPSAGFSYGIGVNMNLSTLSCPAPGGGSTLSINWPHILALNTVWGAGDHSISQIWLTSPGGDAFHGCVAPNCLQSLEAGWNVDPGLNGDNSPHFFTYSTKDGYGLTGCYNLEPTCAGSFGTMTGSGLVLIQNPANTPGWALTSPSITELRVYWYKSPDNNWWLSANGWVGYIPSSLFNNGNGGGSPLGGTNPALNYYATTFEAGGEVADDGLLGTPTTTDMGTGLFASSGSPGAAYQRNAIYTSNNCDPDSDQTDLPAPLHISVTDPTKYTVTAAPPAVGGSLWGTYFYFGGPGAAATAPAVPTGLVVTPWNGAVTMAWTAVANADTYQVHYSTSSAPPGANDWQFGNLSENDWEIDDLTNGTPYYFNIRALNEAGTSAWSAQVSMTPNPPIPPVPTSLTTHGGFQQVTLSWSPASGATSYTVKDATSATGTLGSAHSGITGTSFTYTALSNAKTYYFVVSAQNARGSSADSARVTGLTTPGAPSGVSATAATAKVTVKWSSTTGAVSYTVFRSTTSGTTGPAIAFGVTSTSFVDTSVTHGTKYYYTVVAVNQSGNSPNSSQVNATP